MFLNTLFTIVYYCWSFKCSYGVLFCYLVISDLRVVVYSSYLISIWSRLSSSRPDRSAIDMVLVNLFLAASFILALILACAIAAKQSINEWFDGCGDLWDKNHNGKAEKYTGVVSGLHKHEQTIQVSRLSAFANHQTVKRTTCWSYK